MSFNWKSTLATVAPMIASAVGTPVAGMAVAAGLAALGIEAEAGNEEKQFEQAMQKATPSDMLKLKEADYAFKKDMKKLNIDLAKIDGEDRNSARELAKVKGITPQVILSVTYTLAYAAVMYFFMTGQVNVQDNQQILFGSLIGILTAAQIQILNFWFGSSSGSKEKTAHLAKASL